MLVEPALAAREKFVDLVLADPIVLGVIQHWNQHVEVVLKHAESRKADELHPRIKRADRA
jgi:hypothetical protein